MDNLKKIETLVRNSVEMYLKYAESAEANEDKAYYEGALEAAQTIYDYIISLTATLESNGKDTK